MVKVRKLAKKSGLTNREIGVKMGYPSKSARQSVSRFFKVEDPTLGVVVRFAEAMNIGIEELL